MGIETDKLCYGEFIWDAAVKNAGKRLADDEYTEADIGYLFAAGKISSLEAENARLQKLVDRTCGDGCHCMAENNEKCAALLADKGE